MVQMYAVYVWKNHDEVKYGETVSTKKAMVSLAMKARQDSNAPPRVILGKYDKYGRIKELLDGRFSPTRGDMVDVRDVTDWAFTTFGNPSHLIRSVKATFPVIHPKYRDLY